MADQNLVRSGEETLALSETVEGMAHFAHGGPVGTCCRSCAHWGQTKKEIRDRAGFLKPSRCKLYVKMRKGQQAIKARAGIPPETPSCKYFEARTRDRPLHREMKTKDYNGPRRQTGGISDTLIEDMP